MFFLFLNMAAFFNAFLSIMVTTDIVAGYSALDCPVFTFEQGADRWLKHGSAFRHQPIFGGTPDASGHAGHQGNWLIDSSRNVTSPCRWQNASLGEDAVGTMTSPPFVIRSSGLSFLIGGGCDFQKVRMEILLNGSTVISRTGNCQTQMMRIRVNVAPYIGQIVTIKLVDSALGNWGHILFDDLRHEVPCEALISCVGQGQMCQTPSIQQDSGYNCSCGLTLPSVLSCDGNKTCTIPHGNCRSFCTDSETNCHCRECTCVSGYSFNTSSQSCGDIDECQSGTHDCQHTCINTNGGFQCSCLIGYKLNGDKKSCVDDDECTTNNGGCDHVCVNSIGSYLCVCNQGWSVNPADKRTCIDNDECSLNPNLCSQICVNTLGSYTCGCLPGYKLSADNSECKDINECLINNGGCQFRCSNTPGSFQCSCESGYQLKSDGRTCVDIDECSTGQSSCSQVCVNTPGSFNCSCLQGYQLQDDQSSCFDINECQLNKSDCLQICENVVGGYKCSCFNGYQLSADGRNCSDVDECSHNNGGCRQVCVNTLGGFNCSCFSGYRIVFDDETPACNNSCIANNSCPKNCPDRNCDDVNECDTGDACAQECTNTDGSYRCSCLHGFIAADDGRSCIDVDECQMSETMGCARCVNTPGGFNCICPEGLTFNGKNQICREKNIVGITLTEGQHQIANAAHVATLVAVTKLVSRTVSDMKKMSSEELNKTLSVLKNLSAKIQLFNTTEGQARELLTGVGVMVSSMMEKENEISWKRFTDEKGVAPTTILPEALEKAVSAVIYSLNKDTNTRLSLVVSTPNLDMQVYTQKRQAFEGSKSPKNSPNFVELPKSVVKDSQHNNDTVGISLALLKGMENILSHSSSNSRGDNLNSAIIVATVINVSPEHLANLKEPVILRFKHLKKDARQHKCSFQNETAIGEFPKDASKHWSSVGCKRVNGTDEFTVCHCYHLTSYGLIMDVHNIYDKLDDVHKETLKYISLIGCCISIFFCFLATLGFLLALKKPHEKKTRRETYCLHINLVIAIGLAQVCFVAGTFIVSVNVLACRIISIATHYFLSASFCWMLAEGIHIYNKIVRVFSNKKYNKVFGALGWGAPVLLVLASAGVSFHEYGPHNVCWLSGELIWIFAGPVLIVITINCFILVNVIYVLLTKTMVKAGEENADGKSNARRSIKITVVLLPLLGLTWVFGFMAVDENTIFFHYLFAVVNSLQGIFIFFAHGWINDSVRESLLEKLPNLQNMRKRYEVSRSRGKHQQTFNSSVSLEAATASTTSVRLMTINRSPTNSRKFSDGLPLKLVNFEQKLAGIPDKAYDENSVKLVNMGKLQTGVFDGAAERLSNKTTPMECQKKSKSSMQLVSSDDIPITPKQAYDNPTYAFWNKKRTYSVQDFQVKSKEDL
ncbi:adhesion G protein-coupled receptor E2-like isoform X1 [Montipora capricornis]|uniref:adhesion G protein-coupled receptor E2-like isoform X1 n=2 Tax=Montipora capricornis TaxID=246305 RepID=UPI0035F160CE